MNLPNTLVSLALPSNSRESTSVPPYPVCEEKKCVSVATADSSLLASDRTRLTSGDQCNVVSTAGHTGKCQQLDVHLGGDERLRVPSWEVFQNCSATACAVTGTQAPSGMSHIAFWESRGANCSDCYMPVDITCSTLSCGSYV